MKRLLLSAVCLMAVLLLCLPVLADEEEEINIVDKANATFEGVAGIKETDWFHLVDSTGTHGSGIYEGITIKANGGHTGDNYVSMTSDCAWHSPAINIHPFFKKAGAETYVLSLWYRCTPDVKKNGVMIRAEAGDVSEGVVPEIGARGDWNFYGSIPGKSTDPDENGWRCFVSDPFEITEEQLEKNHSWWMCFGTLPSGRFTLDFDDLVICREVDFDGPAEEEEPVYTGKLNFTADKVLEASADAPVPTAVPEETAAPEATPAPGTPENTKLVWWPAPVALLLCGAVAAAVTVTVSKKGGRKK